MLKDFGLLLTKTKYLMSRKKTWKNTVKEEPGLATYESPPKSFFVFPDIPTAFFSCPSLWWCPVLWRGMAMVGAVCVWVFLRENYTNKNPNNWDDEMKLEVRGNKCCCRETQHRPGNCASSVFSYKYGRRLVPKWKVLSNSSLFVFFLILLCDNRSPPLLLTVLWLTVV